LKNKRINSEILVSCFFDDSEVLSVFDYGILNELLHLFLSCVFFEPLKVNFQHSVGRAPLGLLDDHQSWHVFGQLHPYKRPEHLLDFFGDTRSHKHHLVLVSFVVSGSLSERCVQC